jgi:hypothetical protein
MRLPLLARWRFGRADTQPLQLPPEQGVHRDHLSLMVVKVMVWL